MNYTESDAVLSKCARYRYMLRRTWHDNRMRALLVMLNPSTADAEEDDPTIRSCVRLFDNLGFGSFEVVNLFAWRATKPEELREVTDPVGPNNDLFIETALGRCDVPVVAWGNNASKVRADAVLGILRCRPAIFCFGITKDKQPKHPLYIKTGTQLETFYG